MTKKSQLGLAILLAGLVITAFDPVGPAGAQQSKPDPAQIGRGAKAWAEQCNRCHNLRNIKDQSDGEWSVSVTHMRVRGNIPGQMARDIEAFLKASN